MHYDDELTRPTRLAIAALTATTGGATAFAFTEFGGRFVRMLPETGFHLAAILGAGIAGFVLADGLGRPGVRGAIMGGLTLVAMTLLGAWLGAVLIYPSASPLVGFMGWMALAEAAAYPTILKIWGVAMMLLQLISTSLRQGQDEGPTRLSP